MKMTHFDTVIHAPNRLQICAFLAPLEEAEFKVLRQELDVSDSVLSKHIRQLEEAGYVKQRKSTVDGRQRTWASLTRVGRKAFEQHVEELKRLVLFQTSEP
ncbi:MAG TPA: ArsR family transcriptional regulator [Planctomycetes bacterium]|nr:ArsR family transcriptional regulator [Fuerstiella sp.]HIK91010.1 ArsR family transcriptional regulator [Planctomycetota bacterium]